MKRKNNPQVILTDADGFQNLPDSDDATLLVLNITRREIETLNTASVLERLHVLTDTRTRVIHYRQRVMFQIDGYDEDKRELPEVSEVRAYFKQLVQEWPHWIWFLCRGMGSIGLLMALLCQVNIIRAPKGQTGFGTEFVNIREVQKVFGDMLERGVALFEMYNVPERDVEESAMSAIDEIFGG